MRPQPALRRSDREIDRRSRGQHGVITLAQLEALGLSDRAVRHRVAVGRLWRIHRGVFATRPPTAEGRWMAAVLAVGDGAVLSHRSAGAAWGLYRATHAAADVTLPRRTRRAHRGIQIHSGTTLAADDVTVRSGIPCTSLARTLIDLAAAVDERALARAVERAEELRVFDLQSLEDAVERNRGRRGSRALAAVLASYAAMAVTRSEVEQRFLELVRQAGLPAPEANAWIALPEGGGYSPDFLWRRTRLIAEVDGRAYHARRRAFEHDRRRDRRLALVGFETRRYAAGEVIHEPQRVVRELRAFLAPGRPPDEAVAPDGQGGNQSVTL